MKCLDSSYIVDLLRNDNDAKKKSFELNNELLFTTHINIFEVLYGIFKIRDANHEKRINEFKTILNKIEILNLEYESTEHSAKIAGRLSIEGKQIEPFGCIIAGVALSNGINTIITRDKDHFERIKGIKVESY